VRFGIEDDFVEIQSPGRREKQVEIFKSFGQNEALHFVALSFRGHVGERGIASIRAAIFDEIVKDLFAHPAILWIARITIEIVSGFNNLGTQMIATGDDAHRFVIEDFRFDAVHVPHLEG
jgi:hypothetical protein